MKNTEPEAVPVICTHAAKFKSSQGELCLLCHQVWPRPRIISGHVPQPTVRERTQPEPASPAIAHVDRDGRIS